MRERVRGRRTVKHAHPFPLSQVVRLELPSHGPEPLGRSLGSLRRRAVNRERLVVVERRERDRVPAGEVLAARRGVGRGSWLVCQLSHLEWDGIGDEP